MKKKHDSFKQDIKNIQHMQNVLNDDNKPARKTRYFIKEKEKRDLLYNVKQTKKESTYFCATKNIKKSYISLHTT